MLEYYLHFYNIKIKDFFVNAFINYSWETWLIIVFLGAIFLALVKYTSRRRRPSKIQISVLTEKPHTTITSQDIKAIAGEDIIATQLDLARAYIELDKRKLARQILDHVFKHGNAEHQQAAQKLAALL